MSDDCSFGELERQGLVERVLQGGLALLGIVLRELSDSSGECALCMTQFIHRVCNKINYLLFELRINPFGEREAL